MDPRTENEAEEMIDEAEASRGTAHSMTYEDGVIAGIEWALRIGPFDGCPEEEDTPL